MVYDENGELVETVTIGGETFYVVNDAGFRRHIPSEEVDRRLFKHFTGQVAGNEDIIATMAAEATGKADLFSMAILKNQLKHIDKAIDRIFIEGLPADATKMLGMSGLHVTIDIHGEILDIHLPSQIE